jgi:hypothetical protein
MKERITLALMTLEWKGRVRVRRKEDGFRGIQTGHGNLLSMLGMQIHTV